MLRRANSSRWDQQDTVELEVAFLGNKEQFSKPGESQFDDQPIRKMVPAGTIGNGAFASHIESLFAGDGADFHYIGTSKKDGHKTFRFDFFMPEDKSHFLVRHDAKEGITGYEGSFWVDAETLDLVRLDVKADHIPAFIGVRLIQESIRYDLVQLNGANFLLPRSSQLTAMDDLGNYSLNQVSFERCKQFSGESVITYNPPGAAGSPESVGSASRSDADHP